MAKCKKKPGPKSDRLKILDQDWRGAMRKAMKKKRPKHGWPKPNPDEKET